MPGDLCRTRLGRERKSHGSEAAPRVAISVYRGVSLEGASRTTSGIVLHMALVNVRDYAYNAGTRTWQGTGTGVWACNPASWPRISAFVVRRPRGGVPSLASIAAETAILMQSVRWQRPVARHAPYLMWTPGFYSFPSHLSRFLTESMGLCIAVESARSYGWTPTMPLLDADRLGSHSPFNVPGVRPDFIAQTPNVARNWDGGVGLQSGKLAPNLGVRCPAATRGCSISRQHRC